MTWNPSTHTKAHTTSIVWSQAGKLLALQPLKLLHQGTKEAACKPPGSVLLLEDYLVHWPADMEMKIKRKKKTNKRISIKGGNDEKIDLRLSPT